MSPLRPPSALNVPLVFIFPHTEKHCEVSATNCRGSPGCPSRVEWLIFVDCHTPQRLADLLGHQVRVCSSGWFKGGVKFPSTKHPTTSTVWHEPQGVGISTRRERVGSLRSGSASAGAPEGRVSGWSGLPLWPRSWLWAGCQPGSVLPLPGWPLQCVGAQASSGPFLRSSLGLSILNPSCSLSANRTYVYFRPLSPAYNRAPPCILTLKPKNNPSWRKPDPVPSPESHSPNRIPLEPPYRSPPGPGNGLFLAA